MRTAIMGIGSLGTIVGALISKNGGKAVLIDTNTAHVDALNKNGATVIGKMELKNIPVKAICPDEMEGIYDLVILLTKQTCNDVALRKLLPHLDENSVVCTLQNGIPEETVAKYVGSKRTVGGTVGWGATWVGPGVSMLTSDIDRMKIEIGEMDGTLTDRLERIASIMSLAGEVEIVKNLSGIRWSKLLMNSALSGMSAALGSTYAEVLDDDKAIKCAAHIANELILVADAKDIKLHVLVEGYDFYDLRFRDETGLEKAVAWLRDFYFPHRALKASMLQDMEKGIKCEISHINGVVSQWGDYFSIDTPINDTVVNIVRGFEEGKAFPTMKTLKEFTIPKL